MRAKGRARRIRSTVGLAGAAAAIALVGCGGSDGDGAPTSRGDGPAKVRVAVIPIAPVAPLYLGIDQGFFEQEGLEVEPVVTSAGSPTVPAVLRSDYDFAFANTISLLIAQEQGLPLRIVSQGVLGEARPKQAWSKVLVRDDSDIRSAKDLTRKTVAVNAVKNIGDLTIMRGVQQAGVDPSSVDFLEIPFPEMIAALDAGRVDAIWAVEPFVTIGEAAGHRSVLAPYSATVPDLTIATYFTSTRLAEQQPALVDGFVRAMNRSLEYAEAHPDEVRETIPEFLEIPPEVAAKIELPDWSADLSRETIELTGVLAAEYGTLEGPPNLDALIREPPG